MPNIANNSPIGNAIRVILNTGASRYIIYNRDYFSSFNPYNKTISQGKVKTIPIKGTSYVRI